MTKEDEALAIYIMILSAIRMDDTRTKKAEALNKHLFKGMKARHAKPTGLFSVERIGRKIVKTPIVKPTEKYNKINDMVINAWDKAKLKIPLADGIHSSLGELIQVLWDRMNGNKYQETFCGKARMFSVIESIKNTLDDDSRGLSEIEMLEADNNSRMLANAFFDELGIKKNNILSRKKTIINQNRIIEGKEAWQH